MDPNTIFLVIGGLVLLVVGGAAYGVFLFINPSRTAQDRLREMSDGAKPETFELVSEGDDSSILGSLGKLSSPTSEEDKHRLRVMLAQAGYKNRHALEMFNGIRVTAALCLPILAVPFASGLSVSALAGTVLIAAAVGYYGPALYIQNLVDKRQRDLLNSFPDCLDLLVSSVEAGLGLDIAFRRVATEMEKAAPDLAREFQLVNHEISAGIARVDALKHMEQRTGLDEIRSLVNMLAQSERFGTSIAKSLRVHARMSREKRMARAEEEAAKVSPKLTVVMIIFLLPVLMSILVGPAAIRVMNMLGGK